MSTLAQLTTRLRTLLESATGWTEPLVVTPSAIQLAAGTPSLRGRLQTLLQDVATKWTTDDLDEAIRTTLEIYSDAQPRHAVGTVTFPAATRELSLSTLTGLRRVEQVWSPYVAATPTYPPNWRQFEVWPGSILYIDAGDTPATNDVARIFYTAAHTINGLDSAAATTVPADDIPAIIHGAAAYAARSRAMELSESLTFDDKTVTRLQEAAEEWSRQFRRELRQDIPAWQRRARAFAPEDLEEAMRWALGQINAVAPAPAVTTITLAAAGREISIAALDYINVQRVWWTYDSSNPTYPPNWCDFEVWPGDILYIFSQTEPACGDVVRVFYTTPRTIEDFDSATATTLSARQEDLLIIGAAGIAAEERGMEEKSYYSNTRLRFWAASRLSQFKDGLAALAANQAALHSGIAPSNPLDRSDGDWT